jgi:hypothetical protein
MIINRKMIVSIMAELRHVIPIISKGINHDSAIGLVELLTSVTDFEFIFEKM